MRVTPETYSLIAEQIAISENPEKEFASIANNLSHNWKITLGREVNKFLFKKHLENSQLDSNIEFDVITFPEIHHRYHTAQEKTAGYDGFLDMIEKVASMREDSINTKVKEKQYNITPDMFLIEEPDTTIVKKAVQGQDFSWHSEELSRAIEDDLEAKRIAKQKQNMEKVATEIGELEAEYINALEKIASLPQNEEQQRGVIVALLREGLDEEAEKVASYGRFNMEAVKVVDEEITSDMFKQATLIAGLKRKLNRFKKGLLFGAGVGTAVGIGKFYDSSDVQTDEILGRR